MIMMINLVPRAFPFPHPFFKRKALGTRLNDDDDDDDDDDYNNNNDINRSMQHSR